MQDNQYILKKYLDMAAHKMKGMIKQGGKYKFFCNVCGDDVSTGNRDPRGALINIQSSSSNEKVWIYKCFNGGCKCCDSSWSASYWLYNSFPDLYSDYKRELFLLDFDGKYSKKEETVESKREEVTRDYGFTSILREGDLEKKARDFCKSRLIPSSIYNNFSVSRTGDYAGRLIIPFYDNKGKMYYFQARSLNGEKPKYVNPKDVPKYKGVYNIFNVDRKKPVIVCEGPIDSTFLPNAISVNGSSVPPEIQTVLQDWDVYYLWDNDSAGLTNADKYIDGGKKVFIWKRFLSDLDIKPVKDINDVVLQIGLEKFKSIDILSYFSNNVFDKVFL